MGGKNENEYEDFNLLTVVNEHSEKYKITSNITTLSTLSLVIF